MKIETLKTLIENILEREHVSPDVKNELMMVIELYESELQTPVPFVPTPGFIVGEPDEILYAEICGCNPKNGGNGICGCVMGNKMVPNPKKYGHSKLSNFTSTTSTDTIINQTMVDSNEDKK